MGRPAVSEPLVIGLVGCGRWGRFILRDLRSLGCRVAVVARSEESVGRANEGGAEWIVPDLAQLPEVDGAVVATPELTHGEVMRSLLERGVPVYCEKPFTCSLEEARDLLKEAGERLFVMHKWRYHKGILELARIAREGDIGEVVGLRCTRTNWGFSHDRADVVSHLIPHDLSIVLEILGEVPPVVACRFLVHDGSLSGAMVDLGSRPWAHIEIADRTTRPERRFVLEGSEGAAVLEGSYADAVLVYRGSNRNGTGLPEPELRPISDAMPLEAELAAFLAHLRGGPPPHSRGQDLLDVVAATQEVLQRGRKFASA
jgi:predicted dehydrogenase